MLVKSYPVESKIDPVNYVKSHPVESSGRLKVRVQLG